jgi:pilus assembly protein TadC
MPISMLWNYPEFLLAGVLGLLFFRFRNESEFYVPDWFSRPATTLLYACPRRYVEWLTKLLTWSGRGSNQAFQILSCLKLYGACLVFFVAAVFLTIPLSLFLAVLVFFLADLLLLQLVRSRQRAIREALPQAVDLMVLCVDAGLSLDATVQRVASEDTVLGGALNEELTHLCRDMLFGMERERAYLELYKRTGVDELKTLGSSLNQSGKLGLAITKILRGQSEWLRAKLAQKVEERAAKLPIYMAFPLWFCIMPALLLVVLGPSLILFFKQILPNTGLFQ